MINGKNLIEKLLSYAADSLYLADGDVLFKRTVLCNVLKIKPYERDVLPATHGDYKSLVKELGDYLTENSFDNVCEVQRLVFGLLMPAPSEIEKTFKILREKMSFIKARDYFYSLMKNVGFADCYTFLTPCETDFPFSIFYKSQSDNDRAGLRPDDRRIKLNFAKDYFFGYEADPDFIEQAYLTPCDEVNVEFNDKTLDDMFSFVEYMPDYYIAFSPDDTMRCEKLVVFNEQLPVCKLPATAVFFSSGYHDVEIAMTDWLLPHLRFSGYNKNTVIKLIEETLSAWRGYTTDKYTVSDTNENYFQTVLKLLPDGKFVVDVILRVSDTGTATIRPDDRIGKILDLKTPLAFSFGKIVFVSQFKELLFSAVDIVNGTNEYNPLSLSIPTERLYPLGNVIASVIGGEKDVSDSARSRDALIEEMGKIILDGYFDNDVFKKSAEGRMLLKLFLHSIEITRS